MAPKKWFGKNDSFSIKRPTQTERLYQSRLSVYLRHERNRNNELVFDVVKDRYREPGIKNLPQAIIVCADMLLDLKFQDSNKMFKEVLKAKLIEVMSNVLLGDDVIPTEKAIKEYVEGE